jgi:YfiH family protein
VIRLRAFRGLQAIPGLVHGATTREAGTSRGRYASLNLGRSTGDEAAAVAENRRRVEAALGSSSPLRVPRQVHGTTVVVAEDREGADLGEADAVATGTPGLPVGVLGADCPGVVLVDPVRRALALAHSGWRGTLAGVVPAAVATLRERFGTDVRDLRAGIGPGIAAGGDEVGPDVVGAFRAGFPESDRWISRGRGDRSHLDLVAALRFQLTASGLRNDAVEDMGACTWSAPDLWFSHRRDGPATGRHALVAMWTE